MNRFTIQNPQDPAKEINQVRLNEDEMAVWVGKTGIGNPPVGFRAYIRLTGNLLEWGTERIESGPGAVLPPKGGDSLDGMSKEDLQTRCAELSIKYKKDDGRIELIQLLRAKP